MSPSWIVRTVVVAIACLCPLWTNALAQQPAPSAPVGKDSLKSIMGDYNRQLLQLERQRLDRLANLAASQPPREAGETYEMLFRLAIANNLFNEADPIANRVLKSPETVPAVVRFLAETIDVIAAADRGQYDESLAELSRLVGASERRAPGQEPPSAALDTPSLLIICNAYYQRLVQGGRYDIAHKAFELLAEKSTNPDVKEFSRHRLRQLRLIGKPAPAIRGRDIDGKPVDLAQHKGDVVLVVFWASWLPNAAEVDWLDQEYAANRDRGLQIIGVNLDTLQEAGTTPQSVLRDIRRFLLDHNVRWPTLINGKGESDYAAAYGVTEIPANVLIGRDGTILDLDLSRANLAREIADALKP